MTIHYHGTPITPKSSLYELAGRHLCVSYSDPRDCEAAHGIAQSVMLDNGAFSAYTKGKPVDVQGYKRWVEFWLDCPTTWCVIPDIIDGGEAQNDGLIDRWLLPRSAPVWHMDESLMRLDSLVRRFEIVCIGSAGKYWDLESEAWHERMVRIWNSLSKFRYTPRIHMLRGMDKCDSIFPFYSVDSTDVARNHNRPQNTAGKKAADWDCMQGATHWVRRPEQTEMLA